MYYDNIKKSFIFDDAIERDGEVYFLDRLSKQELKGLNILNVVESEIDAEFQNYDIQIIDDECHLLAREQDTKEKKIKEKLINAFKQKAQEILDKTAQERGYDNILTACSYTIDGGIFEAESRAFCAWRANLWAKAHELLAKYENTPNLQELNLDEILKELPTFSFKQEKPKKITE